MYTVAQFVIGLPEEDLYQNIIFNLKVGKLRGLCFI